MGCNHKVFIIENKILKHKIIKTLTALPPKDLSQLPISCKLQGKTEHKMLLIYALVEKTVSYFQVATYTNSDSNADSRMYVDVWMVSHIFCWSKIWLNFCY